MIQGGKKLATKKRVGATTPEKKVRTYQARKNTSEAVIKEPEPINTEKRLESLAMIHHVHGSKLRRKKTSFFGLTRLNRAVEDNWSIWHLAWSVLWRMVLIVLMIRLLAIVSVVFFGNIILTK